MTKEVFLILSALAAAAATFAIVSIQAWHMSADAGCNTPVCATECTTPTCAVIPAEPSTIACVTPQCAVECATSICAVTDGPPVAALAISARTA